MSNLVFRLPRYYQDSPQVSELERVLGEQAGALRVSESDTLAQLRAVPDFGHRAPGGVSIRDRPVRSGRRAVGCERD